AGRRAAHHRSEGAAMRLSIIGAGSFGTTLAIVAARAGHDVLLWAHDPSVAEGIRRARHNPVYMPAIELDARIGATHSLDEAAAFSDALFMVVPSHHYRRVLAELAPNLPSRVDVISGTKGIENDTPETMSQVT